jgi:beta-galactosidase
MYFNWRACPFGTEEYWYGILDHDGVPRRRYEEIKKTLEEAQSLSFFFEKSETISEVGILMAFDNAWSLEFQPLNPDFRYHEVIQTYYQAFAGNYVNVDFVFDYQNLQKYKILILPSFILLDEKLADKLSEYVLNGGYLITNFFSGTKELNNSVIKSPFPGLLKSICGIGIEDFDCLMGKKAVEINGIMGKSKALIWCDIIKTETAEIIAKYCEGYYKGKTAISRNRYGTGYVYYLGCSLDESGMNQLMKIVMDEVNINSILPYKIDGVDIVRKEIQGKQYLMVLNHNPYEVILKLNKKYESLPQHNKIGEILEIAPSSNSERFNYLWVLEIPE